MTDRLKHMKETLMACIETQLTDLHAVDTKELGEAIDMIKDLEEAIYYCTITEAMKKQEKEEKTQHLHYYETRYMPYHEEEYDRMYYRGQPRDSQGRFTEGGRSYYSGGSGGNGGSSGGNGGNGGSNYYTEREFPMHWRDSREGRSPHSRKMYMESKEMHKENSKKVQDLEKYMRELGEDLVEMITDASPEEKAIMENKLSNLTSKISQLRNG